MPLIGKGASIVLTTSFLNAVGTPGLSVLSATKAAVRSLARSLGAELAPRGIRVNAVSPGPTSTPFAGKMGLFLGIEEAKFRAPVEPGCLLALEAGFVQQRARVCKFWGRASVEGKATCEARFTAMIADPPQG